MVIRTHPTRRRSPLAPGRLLLLLLLLSHILRMRAMRANMLLHVVLARKRLVADGTEHALLARMLLAVARCMARRGEGGSAAVAGRVRTGVLVLPDPTLRRRGRVLLGGADGGRGLRRGRVRVHGRCAAVSMLAGLGRVGVEVRATAARGVVERAHGRPGRRGAHGIIGIAVGMALRG